MVAGGGPVKRYGPTVWACIEPHEKGYAMYQASESSFSRDSGRVLEPPWGHSIGVLD
jgi:hypothetical protein